jgi:DNA adenine methylase
MRSSFRYPGSKEKIADQVIGRFPWRIRFNQMMQSVTGYCEPFIGCGAVAVKTLPLLTPDVRVVFGDLDPGIVGYWRSVHKYPKQLRCKLIGFTPTVDEFYRLKELDGKPTGSELEDGFRKFVLHQMSFSGLGAKAGGPIGGKKQRSEYAVDCRFRPERHARVIRGESLSRIDSGGFAYLDPPYYLQGGALYAHNMTDADHDRLASVLGAAGFDWVLSYDDHPRVHGLYAGWAEVNSFEMTATIDTKRGAGKRRKNNELVITRRSGGDQ